MDQPKTSPAAGAPARAPARNLAVDYYRASGVLLIVLGHWAAGVVTYRDGYFGRQNPLVDQPWTQWLTWPLQAVPVFFLVAGYAGALSWNHRYHQDGTPRQEWLRRRLARVLGPTAVYVGLVSLVVVALQASGVAGSVLEYAGWAVAMHLWFLSVYVLVVSLTPVAVAAQRRWGLMLLVVLALSVIAVDLISHGTHISWIGWLNQVLCWGTFHQLGIAWHEGAFTARKSAVLAAVSAVALALLIGPGPYPISMIGVPGQTVDNTTPPSMALLAFGCAQAGLAMTLAPALNRALRPRLLQRVLSVANNNVMALYLWHMLPVVLVAIIGYPSGLLPQPPQGTAQWWLARLQWVVILAIVAALELALLWWLRRVAAAPLPTFGVPLTDRWTEPILVTGTLMAAYGLGYVSALGFAPNGRFPWITAVVFAAGILLVAMKPAKARTAVTT
ncbi:acyltransferase family protein [Mycobacterium bourgelatii]|uniref:Acyltransferase n=1 Tax=Mycobacterium bourgelatii TaxID=1273442 RepID=A0A7I9YQV3_MYCBU|nr:acyltransferase [Mycobacterium bourgelatii]MCV6974018.1 acyltransferase [Mycobacterium bourgelatii]GFG90977.1 acyltransferase [Mycobacterium bourgelatii]